MSKPRRQTRAAGDPPTSPGERIQHLRGERDWTQDDLAKKVKLSKSFLSELENDHAMPGGQVLLRLAEVLSTTTDYLLRGVAVAAPPAASEAVSIPPELAALAEDAGLSYASTVALLDAKRYVLGRRGRADPKPWRKDEWKRLYEKLRDYLE